MPRRSEGEGGTRRRHGVIACATGTRRRNTGRRREACRWNVRNAMAAAVSRCAHPESDPVEVDARGRREAGEGAPARGRHRRARDPAILEAGDDIQVAREVQPTGGRSQHGTAGGVQRQVRGAVARRGHGGGGAKALGAAPRRTDAAETAIRDDFPTVLTVVSRNPKQLAEQGRRSEAIGAPCGGSRVRRLERGWTGVVVARGLRHDEVGEQSGACVEHGSPSQEVCMNTALTASTPRFQVLR